VVDFEAALRDPGIPSGSTTRQVESEARLFVKKTELGPQRSRKTFPLDSAPRIRLHNTRDKGVMRALRPVGLLPALFSFRLTIDSSACRFASIRMWL